MALDRDTEMRHVGYTLTVPQVPVAAGADVIYAYAMVQTTAAGYAVKVGDSSGDGVGPVRGIASYRMDIGSGAAGSKSLDIHQGLIARKNSSTTPVTWASYGKTIYAEDDETLTADPSYPAAGTMWGFTKDEQGNDIEVYCFIGDANESLGTNLIPLIDEVIDLTALTAAALFETVNLSTPIPTNAIPFVCRSRLITPGAHGTASTAVLTVGNNGDGDAYDGGGDIFTGSAFTGLDWFRGAPGAGIGSPAYDGGSATGQITATVTIDAGTVDSFTAGSVRVQLWGYVLP
jgi:hypothetical protein